MTTAAILLAGGAGVRMAAGSPKAFVHLGGRPLFLRSLEALAESSAVERVVLVVPPDQLQIVFELIDGLAAGLIPDAIVGGGSTRQESVGRGLAALPVGIDRILCHDAARPFASPDLFRSVVDALDPGMDPPDGVIPVVPSPDTIKRVHEGVVIETIPRSETGLAQTPQGFAARALRQAHALGLVRHETDATDDAVLLEAAGFRVVVVPGEPGNFKITTPDDLRRAEQVLAASRPAPTR